MGLVNECTSHYGQVQCVKVLPHEEHRDASGFHWTSREEDRDDSDKPELTVVPEDEQEAVTETVTEEALRLIGGDRQDDYGPAHESFDRIASGWSAVLNTPVTGQQVALCMIWMKVSRQVASPKRDNIVDIIGYAALLQQLVETGDQVNG